METSDSRYESHVSESPRSRQINVVLAMTIDLRRILTLGSLWRATSAKPSSWLLAAVFNHGVDELVHSEAVDGDAGSSGHFLRGTKN
jgi:hypothetical protein